MHLIRLSSLQSDSISNNLWINILFFFPVLRILHNEDRQQISLCHVFVSLQSFALPLGHHHSRLKGTLRNSFAIWILHSQINNALLYNDSKQRGKSFYGILMLFSLARWQFQPHVKDNSQTKLHRIHLLLTQPKLRFNISTQVNRRLSSNSYLTEATKSPRSLTD